MFWQKELKTWERRGPFRLWDAYDGLLAWLKNHPVSANECIRGHGKYIKIIHFTNNLFFNHVGKIRRINKKPPLTQLVLM